MRRISTILSLGALSLAAGCGGGSGAAATSGALTLRVTDAPFPFDAVASATVVISAVEVHDGGSGPWVVVHEGPTELDLVPLTGGVEAILGTSALTPGTYGEVRLIVAGGEVVLKEDAVVAHDSHVFDSGNGGLQVPSGAQTGIKVKIDPPVTVTTGLSADLLLDVDLSRSFVFNGTPDHPPGVRRVLFTPVVRAVNRSTTGRAALEVRTDDATPADASDDDPLAGATVTALDALGAEVGGAVADAAGRAEVVLPPGTYDLRVEAAGHAPSTVEDVAVALSNTTVLPVVTLAALGGRISGTVRSDAGTPGDATDDVGIEGVTVTATPAGGGDAVSTATDAAGAYVLEGLAPGTWDLAFSKAGFADGASPGAVASASGATVDALLSPVP